jgi:AraC family transcriptional regulator
VGSFPLAPRRATPEGGWDGVSVRGYRYRESDVIDADLDEQLSLAELAHTVSLSQYHFARHLREATGTTPHRFVTDRRVERAERLLTSSTLPISLVASACGFSDQSHLTRVFQPRFGATPRAVRLKAAS